jgi:hypothetical protein
MKPLILILLLFSCEEISIPVTGCRTASDKVTHERVFLRCETQDEFNTTNIRSYQWDTTDSLYYDYSFERCEQCK